MPGEPKRHSPLVQHLEKQAREPNPQFLDSGIHRFRIRHWGSEKRFAFKKGAGVRLGKQLNRALSLYRQAEEKGLANSTYRAHVAKSVELLVADLAQQSVIGEIVAAAKQRAVFQQETAKFDQNKIDSAESQRLWDNVLGEAEKKRLWEEKYVEFLSGLVKRGSIPDSLGQEILRLIQGRIIPEP